MPVIAKTVLVGDPFVGKTSLVHRFCKRTFNAQYKATIGSDFLTKDVEVGGQSVSLQVWDTAGQERFKGLGCSYYRGANALVIVFDVTNQASFQHVSAWLEEFEQVTQSSDIPTLIIGNKVDVRNGRVVTAREASAWCAQRGFQYFECSACSGQGVDDAFLWLSAAILESDVKEQSSVTKNSVNFTQKANVATPRQPAPSGGCC